MKPTTNETSFRLFEHMAKVKKDLYDELKYVSELENQYPQIDWCSIYFDKGIKGLKEAVSIWKENFSLYINKDKKGV